MAHFTDGTNDFTADKSLTKSTKPNVLLVEFGDGYEQRIIKGINPFIETYSVSFANRTRTESLNIIRFFEDKKAVTKFVFAPPDLGNKEATTSFNTKAITSTDLTGTVLSPSTPSHILITGSNNNDGGYTLDQSSTATNNNTTLTTTSSFTTENSTASVNIQAGIVVICDTWNLSYSYGDYYSVTGTLRRVYEA